MNDAHIGIQLADGSFYEILAGGDQQARELILEPANPGQHSIRIRLAEGADGRVIRTLGTVSLDDVTAQGSGIRLTVSRDPDGHVIASAEDIDSGNLQSFTVNPEDPSDMDFSGDDDADFGEISFDDLDDGGVIPVSDEDEGAEVTLDDLSFGDASAAGEDPGSSAELGADPDLDDLEIGDFSFETGGAEGGLESAPEQDTSAIADPVAASGAEVAEIDLADEMAEDLGDLDDDFGSLDEDLGALDEDFGGMDAGTPDPLAAGAGEDPLDMSFDAPPGAGEPAESAEEISFAASDTDLDFSTEPDFSTDLGDDLGEDFDLPGEADGTIEGAGDEGFEADFSDDTDFSAAVPAAGLADGEAEDDFSADYSFETPEAGDRFGAAVTAGLVLVSLAGMGGLTFLVFRLLQSAPIPSLTG